MVDLAVIMIEMTTGNSMAKTISVVTQFVG